MRFGRFTETEWILLDFDPWFAAGGYLHGGARVWAQDGTLLGFASQLVFNTFHNRRLHDWEHGHDPELAIGAARAHNRGMV